MQCTEGWNTLEKEDKQHNEPKIFLVVLLRPRHTRVGRYLEKQTDLMVLLMGAEHALVLSKYPHAMVLIIVCNGSNHF